MKEGIGTVKRYGGDRCLFSMQQEVMFDVSPKKA